MARQKKDTIEEIDPSRIEQAMQMAERGYHYESIAHHCGFKDAEAARAIIKERLYYIDESNIEENRALESLQMRKLRQGLQMMLLKGDPKSVEFAYSQLIKLHSEYCKLNNLQRIPSAGEGVQDIRREYIGVNIDEV